MKAKKNHYISVSAKDLSKKCYLENGQIAYNDIMVGEIFDNYSIPETHQKIFLKLCFPNITRTYDAFELTTNEPFYLKDSFIKKLRNGESLLGELNMASLETRFNISPIFYHSNEVKRFYQEIINLNLAREYELAVHEIITKNQELSKKKPNKRLIKK
ncbi:MAG: hypothetical protein ACI4WU_03600 [Bacilli bacterium]